MGYRVSITADRLAQTRRAVRERFPRAKLRTTEAKARPLPVSWNAAGLITTVLV